MKTILLFLLLISSLYSSDKIYVGSSYGYYQESFSVIDAKNSGEIANIKLGYGDIKSYAVEFSLDYMLNKSKIFSSSSSVATDGNRVGFNIALLKSFDLNIGFYPFVKIGFGSGFMDVKRELQNSLSYGSFNLCAGTFIPINDSLDLELGYEYKSISYQAIDSIKTKQRISSSANVIYFGFNVRF